MTPFKLTEQEAASPMWARMKAHFDSRLAELRAQNDSSKPQEQTERLRGRIAETKYFLALDTPAPEVVADDKP
jgi:hypothetical protein